MRRNQRSILRTTTIENRLSVRIARLEALEQRQLLSATPQLIKQINVFGSLDSNPSNPVVVGSQAYFTANDGVHGTGLWRTDGTSAGTNLVRGSLSNPTDLNNVNGTLFFMASGGDLWKSDGTSSGTVLLRHIGTHNHAYNYWFTNIGGTLYFAGSESTNGVELWMSDGTSNGTGLLADIFPGTGKSRPSELVDVNGTLFFKANDGTHGSELWKSDGTSSGTTMVDDILPGATGSIPRYLTNLNGTLFFAAADASHGVELWSSDGTSTGTQLVRDINPNSANAYPRGLTNFNGALYFRANDGSHGVEMWKSDGTSSGTMLVKDLVPNSGSGSPGLFTDLNGELFFTAGDSDLNSQIWKTDGTSSGTTLVRSFSSGVSLRSLINVSGTLFFSSNFGGIGDELWKSDGTSAGTQLVGDINNTILSQFAPSGSANTNSSDPQGLTNFNGQLIFSANDGERGRELWTSDGTSSGTTLFKDINSVSSGIGSLPHSFVGVGTTTFFVATDGAVGFELWRTDGTSSGTVLVKDVNPGSASSNPQYLVNFNGALYFTADDGANGTQLWRSDGTEAGTTVVSSTIIGAGPLIAANGNLYFGGGSQFWKSDGTASGTVALASIGSGQYILPQTLTNASGALYFATANSAKPANSTLWKSDGTSSGTVTVASLPTLGVASLGDSRIRFLTPIGNKVYFASRNDLYVTDGTTSGTIDLKALQPSSGIFPSPTISAVGAANGTCFIVVQTGNDQGFWKSDGTVPGTVRISSSLINYSSSLISYNNSLYFLNGGLWTSNGTLPGTLHVGAADANMLFPLGSGSSLENRAGSSFVSSSIPSFIPLETANIALLNGAIYVPMGDSTHGIELWRSDGTTTGTMLVSEIAAGAIGSYPMSLTAVNGSLYFAANSGSAGQELWVLPPDAPPTASAGGPYAISEGQSLTLDASGSTDPDGDPLTYSWDVNGDGIFGDATGVSPTLTWSQLVALGITNGPGTFNVRVRVNDGFGGVADSAPVVLTINNAPPVTGIAGLAVALRGQSQTFTLTANDPSPVDQAAGFTYAINWGDGSAVQIVSGASGTQVTHPFNPLGSITVSVTATDQDGGVSAAATQSINVVAWQLLPNQANASLTDLIWGGTTGADQVQFQQLGDSSIQISETKLNGVAVNNSQTINGVTGRVIAKASVGNDTLDASDLTSTQATLDGQAGNNTLFGGQSGDILIGGSNGAEGKQGSNTIIAGNGTNTIYGNAQAGAEGSTGGSNLIVSGSGSDTIYGNYENVPKKGGGGLSTGGEGGQNLIVGGGGADTIYASQQTDGAEGGKGSILISGTTTLNPSALSSVLSEWTSTRDYATRIANISGTGSGVRNNGSNFLVPSTTVSDDGAVDNLFSDSKGKNNWLLETIAFDVATRTKPTEAITDL